MIDDFSDTMKSLIEDKNLSSMKAFLGLRSDGKPVVNLNKTPMYSVLQIGLDEQKHTGCRSFCCNTKPPTGRGPSCSPPRRVKQLIKLGRRASTLQHLQNVKTLSELCKPILPPMRSKSHMAHQRLTHLGGGGMAAPHHPLLTLLHLCGMTATGWCKEYTNKHYVLLLTSTNGNTIVIV